jgi:hypothetical protein
MGLFSMKPCFLDMDGLYLEDSLKPLIDFVSDVTIDLAKYSLCQVFTNRGDFGQLQNGCNLQPSFIKF